ncbi:MAG: DUF1848 family protein [Candidatus Zixiibacteriota bacterium]|nr:MAG: DUF1848 family protein [candidate division Zixibacteria bacterium]
MKLSEDTPLVLSASRTKDMVRRSPEALAKILLGKAPCNWGPHGPSGRVDPAGLHAVVLWTKDPRNLLRHEALRSALAELRERYGVLLSLEVTATGLGGSFVEPGLPPWREAAGAVRETIAAGLTVPEAVIYRYDPFLALRTPGGRVVTNARMEVFAPVCSAFLDLGVKRVVASRGDAVRYPRVADRVRGLGLEWIALADEAALELGREMAAFCRAREADFHFCCDPPDPGLSTNWGCIDGKWLNEIKRSLSGTRMDSMSPPKITPGSPGTRMNSMSPPKITPGSPGTRMNSGALLQPQVAEATEVLHNRIGKQRPACRCTYSRDAGYSPGSAGCYSGGFGCLYCYAQGKASPPHPERIREEIAAYDRDPAGYAKERGLVEGIAPAQE